MIIALIIASSVAVISTSLAAWYYQKAIYLQRKLDMAVLSQFQPVIDQLNALPGEIAAKVAAAAGTLPEGAASAQDVTDTLAAVQAAADGAKGATA